MNLLNVAHGPDAVVVHAHHVHLVVVAAEHGGEQAGRVAGVAGQPVAGRALGNGHVAHRALGLLPRRRDGVRVAGRRHLQLGGGAGS